MGASGQPVPVPARIAASTGLKASAPGISTVSRSPEAISEQASPRSASGLLPPMMLRTVVAGSRPISPASARPGSAAGQVSESTAWIEPSEARMRSLPLSATARRVASTINASGESSSA